MTDATFPFRRALVRGRPVTDAAVMLAVAAFTVTGEFGGSGFFGPSLVGLDDRFPPLRIGVPLAVGLGMLTWWRRRFPALLLAGSLLANAIVSAHAAVMLAIYTFGERTSAWPKLVAGMLTSTVLVGIPIWRFAGADGAIPLSMAVCLAGVPGPVRRYPARVGGSDAGASGTNRT